MKKDHSIGTTFRTDVLVSSLSETNEQIVIKAQRSATTQAEEVPYHTGKLIDAMKMPSWNAEVLPLE